MEIALWQLVLSIKQINHQAAGVIQLVGQDFCGRFVQLQNDFGLMLFGIMEFDVL